MRLDIKYKKKVAKSHKHMEAKQYATKQSTELWINQERSLKISRDKWKWKHYGPKPMSCSKSTSKREVQSNTGLHQTARRISNKQLNLKSKVSTERRTNKIQSY